MVYVKIVNSRLQKRERWIAERKAGRILDVRWISIVCITFMCECMH